MTQLSFTSQRRAGRPEASALIWPWHTAVAPSRSHRVSPRITGLLQALVAAAAGAGLNHYGWRELATGAWLLAALVAAAALVSPTGLYLALTRLFTATGRLVGRALGWILLPGLFFLVFAPFRFLFRRGRRDSMKRYFEPDAESYWSRRAPAPAAKNIHERQY